MFMYLMWTYFLPHSEFSCMAKLAKPYPVSGPAYMTQIPNLHHCVQNCVHEVLITIYWARLLSMFTLKLFALYIKD